MLTVEDRAAYKRSMPRVQLTDAHVRNCRVVPTREHLLDRLSKNAVAAEIGVAFGDFTAEILKRTAPRRLHLVDDWSGERYGAGLAAVRERMEGPIGSGQVRIDRGLSVDVLARFDDAYFDWVYIDTSHSYETTRRELELAARKCRSDGKICGHDFTSGNVVTPVPYGVIEACNEFCLRHGWQYAFLTLEHHGHFSFCLEPLTE